MNFKKLATMAALAACGLAATAGLTTGAALAQDAAPAGVSGETAFVFNTFSFLVNGALVMWMAVGFAMLESGLVRSKNTASICLKNIALYSLAGILYYLVGYNLMYVDVSGYIGSFGLLYNASGAEHSPAHISIGAQHEAVSTASIRLAHRRASFTEERSATSTSPLVTSSPSSIVGSTPASTAATAPAERASAWKS